MVPGSELPLMWFTGNFSWQIILLQVEQQLFVPFTVFSPDVFHQYPMVLGFYV